MILPLWKAPHFQSDGSASCISPTFEQRCAQISGLLPLGLLPMQVCHQQPPSFTFYHFVFLTVGRGTVYPIGFCGSNDSKQLLVGTTSPRRFFAQ